MIRQCPECYTFFDTDEKFYWHLKVHTALKELDNLKLEWHLLDKKWQKLPREK
jgi:hypothetical protein